MFFIIFTLNCYYVPPRYCKDLGKLSLATLLIDLEMRKNKNINSNEEEKRKDEEAKLALLSLFQIMLYEVQDRTVNANDEANIPD
ncbi:MAG: hypothetical protein KatS3mg129_2325 [Leptospiraceae bacterium]|nr:MAG: hypothetical protein KatS3mg129_2325 [Leptospiraceae bacterium]